MNKEAPMLWSDTPVPHYHRYSRKKRKKIKDTWHYPCIEVPGCKNVQIEKITE